MKRRILSKNVERNARGRGTVALGFEVDLRRRRMRRRDGQKGVMLCRKMSNYVEKDIWRRDKFRAVYLCRNLSKDVDGEQ